MIGRITYIYSKYYLAVLSFLIVLLIIIIAADPKNLILGLKYYVFLLIFLVWSPQLFLKKLYVPQTLKYIIFIICFVMPFYGLFIGLINSFINVSTWGKEVIYFNSFFFFLLIIIILNSKIDLTYKFNFAILTIVVLTMGIYITLLFLPATSKILFQYLVNKTATAAFGYRNYGDFSILMVWYRTSPLLVFPLTFFLHHLLIEKNRSYLIPKYIALVSIIFTLFLSGTRANLLSVTLILIIYLSIFLYKNYKKLFILFIGLILILGFYQISNLFFVLFSKEELSNIIKYGHLVSYLDHFTKNPLSLIFGQGIGIPFYTSGFHKEVFTTELQYFEMVRIWGLPITLLFLSVLLLPIIKGLKTKKNSDNLIAYIAFLFIAGTNPFLLDSTGMIVLVYVFSKMYLKSSEVQKLRGSDVQKLKSSEE